jgi:hypothetical protein
MFQTVRQRRRITAVSLVAASALAVAAAVPASAGPVETPHHQGRVTTAQAAPNAQQRSFHHVGTFDVTTNGNEVAEIVDATKDGETLIFTDSATGSVGFVDVSDPADPQPAGKVEVGGEPTSVAIGATYALVGVSTGSGTDEFTRPTGELVVIELSTREIVTRLPLGGQPDSVTLSPSGKRAAIVLENQRDEELNDGLIPQLPGGSIVAVEITGDPSWWPLRYVDFTDLPMAANTDPEPEFVDIDQRDRAVVSFQENNHLAVVDLRTGKIISDFPAGSAVIEQIDTTEEALGPQGTGRISFTETIERRREPDSVAWVDHDTFATANEGDYEDENGDEGGSRGFTLFNVDGTVEYESGGAFEHSSASAGHYNEARSANKGGEPEAIEAGRIGGRQLLFVGAERANILGVYDTSGGVPQLLQMLPTGIGPEGVKLVSARNLLVAASETAEGIAPSMITIYAYGNGPATYPQLVSEDDAAGTPIPWVAMSGLVGDPGDADTLYGVNDSFLAEAGIFTIDVSGRRARITERVLVSDAAGTRNDLDLEGIAVAPEGGFWVASEGRVEAGSSRPNAILRVDEEGAVQDEVELPADVIASATSSGLEGIAVTGDGTTEFVYVAQQREWGDDPAGVTKIGRYEPTTGEWTVVGYPLDAVESPAGGWVGLSEITLAPDGRFVILERDNQGGTAARVKRLYVVDLADADFQPFVAGQPLPVVDKELAYDLLPVLEANSIWTPDKVEGAAVTADQRAFVVTDNDGLDEATGQTVFVELDAP